MKSVQVDTLCLRLVITLGISCLDTPCYSTYNVLNVVLNLLMTVHIDRSTSDHVVMIIQFCLILYYKTHQFSLI